MGFEGESDGLKDGLEGLGWWVGSYMGRGN